MKKSIKAKIIISYLIIISLFVVIISILFNIFAKKYLEKMIMEDFKKEVRIVIQLLKDETGRVKQFNEKGLREVLKTKVRIKKLGLQSNIDFIIQISKNEMKIIQAIQKDKFDETTVQVIKRELLKRNKRNFKFNIKGEEYLASVIPISVKKSNINQLRKISLLIYVSTSDIKQLTNRIFVVIFSSLVIVSVFAVFFGIFFAKTIAKPIEQLKYTAEKLAKRQYDIKIHIKTGDELEKLGNTINKMGAELKEYDISQKKFLQNASHELKTPLMSIQGYAEGIKDGVFEDTNQALDIIIEESIRLKKIVEEIIYLSKLETMENFYKFSQYSLNQIIKKSISKIESIAVKKNIKVFYEQDKDIIINIDKDKFIQVFINILSNCLKYAQTKIKISVKEESTNIKVIITDDGKGFEEEDLKNIFKRFYKGKNGDTGLGMAITKAIIKKHNGTITASNNKNKGAKFVITLTKQ